MSKLLKKQREDLGTPIKEIASDTHIKESCLLAIEDEDYAKLTNEVDTRGYIRDYAKYLGLPVESVLAPYEKYLEMNRGAKGNKLGYLAEIMEKAEQKKQQNVPRQEDHDDALSKEIKIPTEAPTIERVDEKAEQKDKQNVPRQEDHDDTLGKEVKTLTGALRIARINEEGRAKRNKRIWKGTLLFLVLVAIIYQFVSSKMGEKAPRLAPVSSESPAQKEQAVKAKAPIVASKEPKAKEKIIPAQKKHLLEIDAADLTWIRVVIDGNETKEALLQPGQRTTYKATNFFSIIIGNAGGCTVKFDGTALPGGKKGQVVRRTLPEQKSPAPKAEAHGKSVKKIRQPKPTVPAQPGGSDQEPNAKVPLSTEPGKPAEPSRP
jgi:cytoskeletal protein RodZ